MNTARRRSRGPTRNSGGTKAGLAPAGANAGARTAGEGGGF